MQTYVRSSSKWWSPCVNRKYIAMASIFQLIELCTQVKYLCSEPFTHLIERMCYILYKLYLINYVNIYVKSHLYHCIFKFVSVLTRILILIHHYNSLCKHIMNPQFLRKRRATLLAFLSTEINVLITIIAHHLADVVAVPL